MEILFFGILFLIEFILELIIIKCGATHRPINLLNSYRCKKNNLRQSCPKSNLFEFIK
jgi:hypothetical protein